jgi:hypothetical protein
VTELETLTLVNLAGGAAPELFAREFGFLLENVQDPNTPAEKARTVTITVKVEPTEDRESGTISVEVKSKLAPPKPAVSMVYMGRRDGKAVAVGRDPRQRGLFDGDGDPDVAPISSRREAQ